MTCFEENQHYTTESGGVFKAKKTRLGTWFLVDINRSFGPVTVGYLIDAVGVSYCSMQKTPTGLIWITPPKPSPFIPGEFRPCTIETKTIDLNK